MPKNTFFPLHNPKIHYVKHILHQSLNTVRLSSSWCCSLSLNDPFGISLQLCQATHIENLHASFLLGEQSTRACCWYPPKLNASWLWAVQAKRCWCNRWHLFCQRWLHDPENWKAIHLQKELLSPQIGNHRLISCYHFFAISHGVTPLRWQKKNNSDIWIKKSQQTATGAYEAITHTSCFGTQVMLSILVSVSKILEHLWTWTCKQRH